jgi:hypothetical protein
MNQPKKTQTPLIQKVEELPPSHRPQRQTVYADVIKMIQEAPAGIYKINIPNKKPTTILNVLRKRIISQHLTNLKVYIRTQDIYIQKFEKQR